MDQPFAGTPEHLQPSGGSMVDTTVIKHFESDVRLLLDYLDREWLAPELIQAVRRLRKVVGES